MMTTFVVRLYKDQEHADSVALLWNAAFPQHQISPPNLRRFLSRHQGFNWVATRQGPSENGAREVIGLAISHKAGEGTGLVSALCVSAEHRSRGIGTALLRQAIVNLESQGCGNIKIRSSRPYFWPGLPLSFGPDVESFFVKRGFVQVGGELNRDFYIDLEEYEPLREPIDKAAREGFSFEPWTEAGYEECMSLQRANFGDNPIWVGAYERLAERELHRQVMVARNSNGEQVGWTLMIEPDLPGRDDMVFADLMGPKTALIGCVGVDYKARKQGIGQALVLQAMQDLQSRGMRHIFVDEVVLKGWYERLGFKVWQTYKALVYKREK